MENGVSERVLVVEGDPAAADLAEVLQAAGYRVSTASSLRRARELLRMEPIDAILLAAQLPDGDSLPFCSELRESLGWTPVIVFCGPARPSTRVVALEVGADDVVSPPIDSEELLARLAAHLRRR